MRGCCPICPDPPPPPPPPEFWYTLFTEFIPPSLVWTQKAKYTPLSKYLKNEALYTHDYPPPPPTHTHTHLHTQLTVVAGATLTHQWKPYVFLLTLTSSLVGMDCMEGGATTTLTSRLSTVTVLCDMCVFVLCANYLLLRCSICNTQRH